MDKRMFQNKPVSLLGYGCMRFPTREENGERRIDRAEAEKLLDCAYAAGVNYYDTAYGYHGGESEQFLGEAMKKYPRESFYFATKLPIWMMQDDGPERMEEIFSDQLRRLQTDYIDFYLLHGVDADGFETVKRLGAYDFIRQKQAEGKVRHVGISFHDTPEVLEKILDTYAFDFVQIQLNYLDWTMQNAKRQYELLEERGIPCVVMEPVRGGALASLDKDAAAVLKQARPQDSVASWAMRFVASLPGVLTILSGMTTMDQLQDNLGTLSGFSPLSDADRDTLETAIGIFRKNGIIPCTGCWYCMDCPVGVQIPDNFSRYNIYTVTKDEQAYRKSYEQFEPKARASACVACGRCASRCPQQIDIPAKLKMIADMMEK